MNIALIQVNAGSDKRKNLDQALRLTLQAIRNKAEFILLPEIFHFRGKPNLKTGYRNFAESIPGPSSVPLMILARAHKVFILAGSLYEKSPGTRHRVYNTSVLINDKGKIQAKYRKVNLFEARLGKKSIDETTYLKAGRTPAVTSVKGFKIGMSICYDLRFSALYEEYRKRRIDILTVPSSFTKPTGQAHWEVLLRARAIENLCYVLAPNQFGKAPSGVFAYGNSMIVDPWGKVLAKASSNKKEVIYVTLHKTAITESRQKLPGIMK